MLTWKFYVPQVSCHMSSQSHFCDAAKSRLRTGLNSHASFVHVGYQDCATEQTPKTPPHNQHAAGSTDMLLAACLERVIILPALFTPPALLPQRYLTPSAVSDMEVGLKATEDKECLKITRLVRLDSSLNADLELTYAVYCHCHEDRKRNRVSIFRVRCLAHYRVVSPLFQPSVNDLVMHGTSSPSIAMEPNVLGKGYQGLRE
jgi:hypothetical protein